jgi:MFS family permease
VDKNVKYFQISQAFASFSFGIALVVPYMLYRGFSIEQAFSLVSFFALVNIITEFPTGVIGDYYSHRFSVILGIVISIICSAFFVLDLPLIGYYIILGFSALGVSLVQGSDLALLKSISPNFKIEFALMGSVSDFVIFLAALASGFIVMIDIRLPWIMNIFPYTVAILFLLFIKDSRRIKGIHAENMLAQSRLALDYVFKHKAVLIIVVLAGILGGYAISIKTLTGSFVEVFDSSPQIVAWLVSLVFLSRAIGKKFAVSVEKLGYKLLFILLLLTLVILAYAPNIIIAGFALIVGNFILGVLIILLNSFLVEETVDGIEASVLSLRNLLVRTFSSGYLFFFGFLLARIEFGNVILLTILLFLVLGLIYYRYSIMQQNVA